MTTLIFSTFFLAKRICFFILHKQMKRSAQTQKRGFTTPEKWIIWGVFCLIVGVSAYRFSIFAGLMLLSFGVSLVHKRERLTLGITLAVVGCLSLIFSKYLV